MSYTNKGNVQAFLNVDIGSTFDAQINAWISAVEKWIDRYTGKSFEISATETTRYFDTYGGKSLFVDSFTGVPTSIQILNSDGSVAETLVSGQSNDYLLYPLNSVEKSEIVLTSNARRGSFGHGASRVKVTALFGYTAVPDDIVLVATKLVANIVEKGLKGGKLASVSLGDFTSSFEKIDEEADAMGITAVLDSYREIAI
jgi:hypothetical protein